MITIWWILRIWMLSLFIKLHYNREIKRIYIKVKYKSYHKQNLNIFNYSWNIIIILNDTAVFLMMDVKLLVLVLTLNIQEHSYLIIMAAIMSRGRGGRILPPRTRSQNSYSGYPADGLWVLLINSISVHLRWWSWLWQLIEKGLLKLLHEMDLKQSCFNMRALGGVSFEIFSK